ncbi:MAG: type II secretion system protein GspK [Planctomycetota bacterium]
MLVPPGPMPATHPFPAPTTSSTPSAGRERGVALVLALIFSILLYILVAELVVSGRMVRATGENDALLARMRTQMLYQLRETEDQLLADLGSGSEDPAGGDGGGGLGGAMGGALGGGGAGTTGAGTTGTSGAGQGLGALGGGAGGEGEGEQSDPAAGCDSSRDAWFAPIGHPDNDVTTYVFVEDENRKFNVLSLWSPDEKFAEFSRDRLVRLIDSLREDSDFDVSSSDAMRIAQELLDWGRRPGTEMMPRSRLKSDDPKRREVAGLMHLDELLLLQSVSEELFYDKVLDGRYYPGLESVLTIWTSLRVDPGNPEKVARLRAAAQARGETVPDGGSGANPAAGSAPGGAGAPGGADPRSPGQASDEPVQPDGLGIRINVNTAPRAVLRALFPIEVIPDRVIDAILKYRNEVDEEAQQQAQDAQASGDGAQATDFGDLRLGEDVKRKFFATTADLEKVEEFAKLADPQVKSDFQKALTTKSEVFTIHLATLYKRSEENRVYLLRRARSVVLRLDDGADGKIVPLVPFEERVGLRLQPIDIQESDQDLSRVYSDLDQFSQEERAWNPFLIEFYLPKHRREDFYRPQ